MAEALKVLFLASEADPFFKVGGLGDYAGSLPSALREVCQKNGQALDIRVCLPFHDTSAVDPANFRKIANLEVPKRKGSAKGSAYSYNLVDIPYYFIKRAGKASGFSSVYSHSPIKDARKYIFYCLASLQLMKKLNWKPDIIHANDWHSAVAVYQLKHALSADPFFNKTHSLLVIHNLPFMGAGTEEVLNEFNIPPLESPDLPEWSKHFPLVLGMASADKIAAVSPTYMQELKQEEFGNGLKDFFIREEEKTIGILNGIDYSTWNPHTDPNLKTQYSSNNLQDKMKNKEEVLRLAGLKSNLSVPLLVAVTRLDIQKGTDLIISAIPQLVDMDWKLVILGSGDNNYEKRLLELQSSYPDRMCVFLEFNAPLSHQLYAGGDIFLMPSRYEPCGLSQMIAMRYGCIPVARAVGGLKDTINSASDQTRTGYLFRDADAGSFSSAVRQALNDYRDDIEWNEMQRRAMTVDYSWERSAGQYLQIYRDLINSE